MDCEYAQVEPIVQRAFQRRIKPRSCRAELSWAQAVPDSARGPALTPDPISTAPQDDDRPLLLFCPEPGGWHIGVWFLGKWLAYIDTSVVLFPTHWLPVPPDPPAAAA